MAETGRTPDYVVRVKEDESGYWFTAGAAWKMREKDGYAVRLTKIPVGGWDGSFILVPPLSDSDAKDEQPEPSKGKGRK